MSLIKKNTLHQKQQKGFSLLEVLISVILISFGLISMATLQNRSANLTTKAYTETLVASHLQEMVEMLRGDKAAAIQGAYNVTALSTLADIENGDTIAARDRYAWFSNLNSSIGGAKASINCQTDSVCTLALQYDFSGEIIDHSVAVIL